MLAKTVQAVKLAQPRSHIICLALVFPIKSICASDIPGPNTSLAVSSIELTCCLFDESNIGRGLGDMIAGIKNDPAILISATGRPQPN
jgi:hypothetical protein